MGLVITAAALTAAIFLLFRAFERYRVPLLPALAVNYLIAFVAGALHTPPWHIDGIGALWPPSLLVGVLFAGGFYLTGLSSQRAGVAASTVASKLSLVLTVLAAVVVHGERPGPVAWAGVLGAALAVVLASLGAGKGSGGRHAWVLPLLLFLSAAAIDITLDLVRREHHVPDIEAVFPTLCFIWACLFASILAWRSGQLHALIRPATWYGGIALGVVNFAVLFFILRSLTQSGMAASAVFPLISIGTILIGTLGSVMLFKERPKGLQLAGIGCAIIALCLLLVEQV